MECHLLDSGDSSEEEKCLGSRGQEMPVICSFWFKCSQEFSLCTYRLPSPHEIPCRQEGQILSGSQGNPGVSWAGEALLQILIF